MSKVEEDCPECKGKQLIVYSPSRGAEYCKTCRGSGTDKPFINL